MVKHVPPLAGGENADLNRIWNDRYENLIGLNRIGGLAEAFYLLISLG